MKTDLRIKFHYTCEMKHYRKIANPSSTKNFYSIKKNSACIYYANFIVHALCKKRCLFLTSNYALTLFRATIFQLILLQRNFSVGKSKEQHCVLDISQRNTFILFYIACVFTSVIRWLRKVVFVNDGVISWLLQPSPKSKVIESLMANTDTI